MNNQAYDTAIAFMFLAVLFFIALVIDVAGVKNFARYTIVLWIVICIIWALQLYDKGKDK